MVKKIIDTIQKNMIKTSKTFSKCTENISNQLLTEEAGQLVFIFIIFLAVTYKDYLFTSGKNSNLHRSTFSQSSFGKIFVLILVVYYFLINPKFGLIVSILFIFYYYSDLIQSYYLDQQIIPNTNFNRVYEGYENPSIVLKNNVENPYFDGSFNGYLTTPDNSLCLISTCVNGNLKEFNTVFEGDLTMKLAGDFNNLKLTYYDTLLTTKFPNMDTSFSYIDGFMNGNYHYQDKVINNYTCYLKGNVLHKKNTTGSIDSVVLHMNSLDSNIQIIKNIIPQNDLPIREFLDLNGYKTPLTIITDAQDETTGTLTVISGTSAENSNITIPLSSFDIKGFIAKISNSDSKKLRNYIEPTIITNINAEIPNSLFGIILKNDTLNHLIPSFDSSKEFSFSIKSNFSGFFIPPGKTATDKVIVKGIVNLNVESITNPTTGTTIGTIQIGNGQIIQMKIIDESYIENAEIVKENFTTFNNNKSIENIESFQMKKKIIENEEDPFSENYLRQRRRQPHSSSGINLSGNPYASSGNVVTGNVVTGNVVTGNTRIINGNVNITMPETFKNMETSEIKNAYPFTKDQHTIPSKFYTNYDYKLPPVTNNKSFFSDFFSNILSSSESKNKENFTTATDAIKFPYYDEYQSDKNSQTQNDFQNNQFPNIITNPQIDQFRKSYCINNQLMYKNTPVRPEMAEHVFPNLQINGVAGTNGMICNPCDPTCPISFSFIDQRLENENIIQKRIKNEYKDNNLDWVPKFFDVFSPNPMYPDFNNNNNAMIGNSNSSYLIPAKARIMPF